MSYISLEVSADEVVVVVVVPFEGEEEDDEDVVDVAADDEFDVDGRCDDDDVSSFRFFARGGSHCDCECDMEAAAAAAAWKAA